MMEKQKLLQSHKIIRLKISTTLKIYFQKNDYFHLQVIWNSIWKQNEKAK